MVENINSKLYTSEASKSKEKVVEELKVPDPPLEIAKALLEQEEEQEEEEEEKSDSASPQGND